MSKAKPKYVVKEEAIKTPRRYYIKDEKVWVGIGGSITVTAKPPAVSKTIPEASEEQYLKIAETCPLVEIP